MLFQIASTSARRSSMLSRLISASVAAMSTIPLLIKAGSTTNPAKRFLERDGRRRSGAETFQPPTNFLGPHGVNLFLMGRKEVVDLLTSDKREAHQKLVNRVAGFEVVQERL